MSPVSMCFKIILFVIKEINFGETSAFHLVHPVWFKSEEKQRISCVNIVSAFSSTFTACSMPNFGYTKSRCTTRGKK